MDAHGGAPASDDADRGGGADDALQLDRAVERAYRALAARDRTVAQLREWLERKGIQPDAVEHAVAQLLAAGAIDDERYALRFAEDKRELERWGPERIERELRRRGVAPELIAAALAAQDRDGELEAAIALLVERTPPLADDRERDRAWRLLVRKGYGPELAYEAVRAHERQAAA